MAVKESAMQLAIFPIAEESRPMITFEAVPRLTREHVSPISQAACGVQYVEGPALGLLLDDGPLSSLSLIVASASSPTFERFGRGSASC